MGRGHNHKGRSRRDGPFLMLPHFVLKCEAYRELRPIERAILIEIMALYKGEGSNNGALAASHREVATRVRCGKNAVSPAIKRLVELGFLEIETPSAFSRTDRMATEYLVTLWPADFGRHRGQPALKTFMR